MRSATRQLELSVRVAAQYARTFAAVQQVRRQLVPDTLDDLEAEDWEDDDWEPAPEEQRHRVAALGRLAKLVDAFAVGSIRFATLSRRAGTETDLPAVTDADTSAVGDVLDRMRDIADQRRAGDISAEQAASWLRRAAGELHQHWQQEQLVEANDRPEAVYFAWRLDPAAQHCDECPEYADEVRRSEDWDITPGDLACGTSCRCELEEVAGP